MQGSRLSFISFLSWFDSPCLSIISETGITSRPWQRYITLRRLIDYDTVRQVFIIMSIITHPNIILHIRIFPVLGH